MALRVVSKRAREYQILSSDEKPTAVAEGSTAHLVDTGQEYVFFDGMWEPDYRRIYATRLANQ